MVELLRQNRKAGDTLFAMNTITQIMCFRQWVSVSSMPSFIFLAGSLNFMERSSSTTATATALGLFLGYRKQPTARRSSKLRRAVDVSGQRVTNAPDDSEGMFTRSSGTMKSKQGP